MKLSKEEAQKYFEQYTEVMQKISAIGPGNDMKIAALIMTEIPEFIQNIYEDGYNAGLSASGFLKIKNSN